MAGANTPVTPKYELPRPERAEGANATVAPMGRVPPSSALGFRLNALRGTNENPARVASTDGAELVQLAKGQRDRELTPPFSRTPWPRSRRAVPMPPLSPTIRRMQGAVAERYGLTVIDLVSDRRGRSEARPRMLVMWLAKHCTTHSLAAIGRHFGGRDHSTVAHAVRRIDELMRTDAALAQAAAALRARFVAELLQSKPTLRLVA